MMGSGTSPRIRWRFLTLSLSPSIMIFLAMESMISEKKTTLLHSASSSWRKRKLHTNSDTVVWSWPSMSALCPQILTISRRRLKTSVTPSARNSSQENSKVAQDIIRVFLVSLPCHLLDPIWVSTIKEVICQLSWEDVSLLCGGTWE